MSKIEKRIISSERLAVIKNTDWGKHEIVMIPLTPYQIRFIKGEEKIDYYLISGKYFNITTQKWGRISVNSILSLFEPPDSIAGMKPPRTKNSRELSIVTKYMEQGYHCLKRGWPDFCFFNDKEVFFVEVKNDSEKELTTGGLNKYQSEMIGIFKRLGLNVRVEYEK